ncbi:hypothetical protein ACHAXT_008221 [Thalassiosira profunda]
MEEEYLGVHLAAAEDPANTSSVLLLTLLLGIVIAIAMGVIRKGRHPTNAPAADAVSAEEREARRRRALLRFGGGGAAGGAEGAGASANAAEGGEEKKEGDREGEDAGQPKPAGAPQPQRDVNALRAQRLAKSALVAEQSNNAAPSEVDQPEKPPAEKMDVDADLADATAANGAKITSIGVVKDTANAYAGPNDAPCSPKKRPKDTDAAMAKKPDAEAATSKKMKPASEVTAGAAGAPASTTTARKRPQPPPAQLLCEALSVVCGADVTVSKGDGSWGGEGWVPRKKRVAASRTSNGTEIVLPLIEQRGIQKPESTKEEWTQLDAALQSITHSSSTPSQFRSILAVSYKHGLVATAASWHGKTYGSGARDTIDGVLRTFRVGSDGSGVAKEGLGQCLATLGQYVVTVLSTWIEKDIASPASFTQQPEEEESDGEDLFSEFYESAKASQVAAVPDSKDATALGEFLGLCSKQNAALVLPRKLIGEVLGESSRAQAVLQRALDRLLRAAPDQSKSNASFDTIAADLAAVSHLMTCPDIAKTLVNTLRGETVPLLDEDGKAFESSSILRTLLQLGAYTAPPVGLEGRRQSTGFRFYDALNSIEAFPLGVYTSPMDASVLKVEDEARRVMKHTRSAIARVIGQCMKKKGGDGKDAVFAWLRTFVRLNERHASLIQEQLLDERDAVHQTVSSRPFLLGTAFSVLEVCTQNLLQAYEKNGVDTFNARYLLSDQGSSLVPTDERRLVDPGSAASKVGENVPSFSGATEFFFVTASLLRVSLFPAMRIRNEHASRYKSIFAQIRQLAQSKGDNSRISEASGRIVAGLLGWDTCLDDRDAMVRLVDFSLLQLRFVADLACQNSSCELLSVMPESMVKLPAQYISHVASHFQRHLTPIQAEDAVRYATVLLGSGVKLSVQVRTELMRISGAFVRASVNRAAARQMRKQRRPIRSGSLDGEEDDFIDRRDLDIYTSLDKNDHGVVVFASPVASKQLGPALVKTFVALEAVEGLDVEKEKDFFKNMVQQDLAELILRLWQHPSGEFRKSIVTLDASVLNRLFQCVAASISMDSDTVYQTILDVKDTLEAHRQGFPMNPRTAGRLNNSYGRLASFLGSMRRYLMMLSYLSQDEGIAALLGGACDVNTASSDLGIMIVGLLDKFTGLDGGAANEVDFRAALKHATDGVLLGQTALSANAKELLEARAFAQMEFGLDASVIAHLLLALAARWTLAAGKRNGQNSSSALITSIASHDDFDIEHFRGVCDRLIVAAQSDPAAGGENLVVKADGHVDSSLWIRYESPKGIGLEEARRQRKASAAQDQMTHKAIDEQVAGVDKIKHFLEELGKEAEKKAQTGKSKAIVSDEELLQTECQMLSAPGLEKGKYTDSLKEWVVSSESFGADHFYSSNAETSSNATLGKLLLKDARKCRRLLPSPHPNASIFVCYGEERMDMARALVVGATGTPYAMGAFVFDICYPQLFPACPPMLHFMTTGGGQVRFSPNLYNDGKVCLSLLGTTNAGDDSQRWQPDSSSLAQVLLSIQSQILDVAEPYFAEGGGHGGLEGTQAGERGSRRYNNTLRLATLRHAIIEPLGSPPKGFEDVTRRHFAMCKRRILVQAKVWLMESKETELHGRFVKAYRELVALLSSDELAGDSGEEGSEPGSLPPLPDDLQALQLLDGKLAGEFTAALGVDDSSQPNDQVEDVADESEELNEAMLARALELSLQER